LSARALLRRLGWRPGHRVEVDVVGGALLVALSVDGPHAVGSRGDLALSATARTLCCITVDEAVIVAAYPAQDVVLVHPAGTVAGLIHELHLRLPASHAG
jgi:hypothetical protein